MTEIIEPDEVEFVLLRGDQDWLPVARMSPAVWRLADGTNSDRGKRGFLIELVDGERITVGADAIVGVR